MLKIAFISILCVVFFVQPVFAGDYDLYMKSGHKATAWDGMIKAGFNSFDGGDYQTGLVFMNRAYALGCRDGLLLFKLGLYYETQKNFKEAERYLKEAEPNLQKQYPDHKETKNIHEHLARIYYQSDRFDRALPEIEEALKATPDSFMLLFMSAQIYRLQKNYPQAIANFEKALLVPMPPDLKPDPKKAVYSELMTLYYELKDFANCLKYAEMVLTVAPNDRAALSYRQQIQTMQYKQREQEAIKKIIQ